jgi:hypothetical protein
MKRLKPVERAKVKQNPVPLAQVKQSSETRQWNENLVPFQQ